MFHFRPVDLQSNCLTASPAALPPPFSTLQSAAMDCDFSLLDGHILCLPRSSPSGFEGTMSLDLSSLKGFSALYQVSRQGDLVAIVAEYLGAAAGPASYALAIVDLEAGQFCPFLPLPARPTLLRFSPDRQQLRLNCAGQIRRTGPTGAPPRECVFDLATLPGFSSNLP